MLAYLRSVIVPVTVAELIQEYLYSPAFLSLSTSSQAPYRRVVNRLACDAGERSVRSLTRRDIEALLISRSPGAANDLLKKIRILLRFAIERDYSGMIPRSAFAGFPRATATTPGTKTNHPIRGALAYRHAGAAGVRASDLHRPAPIRRCAYGRDDLAANDHAL